MIVGIHQPQYLPWLGYFNKILRSDAFVLLDDVQYKKNEWQNRNRVPSPHGTQWLTAPAQFSFGQNINEVLVPCQPDWRKKHLQALRTIYSRAPFFKEYFPFFEEAYQKEFANLAELNIFFIREINRLLGIKTPLYISSEMKVEGAATDRLVNICKHLNAEFYLSGEGGHDYLEPEKFTSAEIKLLYQAFKHPTYPQTIPESWERRDFVSHLAIVDLLFNAGADSLAIIGQGFEFDRQQYHG